MGLAQPDCVIFDLDGTLSDPQVGIARCINYALAHYGFDTVEPELLAVHIGPPIDQAFSAITGVTSAAELRAFVSKYRERYADVGYAENVLYPGIGDALATLSAAGAPLGVCTSKRVDFAERILTMFGLRQHFGFVDGGEIGVHKWQQLEGLLARRVISRSSIMVGDRAVDLIAAHRNGLRAAGVLWGARVACGARERAAGLPGFGARRAAARRRNLVQYRASFSFRCGLAGASSSPG